MRVRRISGHPDTPALAIKGCVPRWLRAVEPQVVLLLSLVGVSRSLLVPMSTTSSGCGRSAGLNGRRRRVINVLEILCNCRVGDVLARLRVS